MPQCKISPRDFIKGRARGFVITVDDVMEYCQVTNQEARMALVGAFGEHLVQPVYRAMGSTDEWKIHLMAIARMANGASDIEVAFLRS